MYMRGLWYMFGWFWVHVDLILELHHEQHEQVAEFGRVWQSQECQVYDRAERCWKDVKAMAMAAMAGSGESGDWSIAPWVWGSPISQSTGSSMRQPSKKLVCNSDSLCPLREINVLFHAVSCCFMFPLTVSLLVSLPVASLCFYNLYCSAHGCWTRIT